LLILHICRQDGGMVLDVLSHAGAQDVASAAAVTAAPKQAGGDCDRLLETFNRGARRPESFGGLAGPALLLDQIARAEQQPVGTVWIPERRPCDVTADAPVR
jgi:hypothetical protein